MPRLQRGSALRRNRDLGASGFRWFGAPARLSDQPVTGVGDPATLTPASIHPAPALPTPPAPVGRSVGAWKLRPLDLNQFIQRRRTQRGDIAQHRIVEDHIGRDRLPLCLGQPPQPLGGYPRSRRGLSRFSAGLAWVGGPRTRLEVRCCGLAGIGGRGCVTRLVVVGPSMEVAAGRPISPGQVSARAVRQRSAQGSQHGFRVTFDHSRVGQCSGIGFTTRLLPVPQGCDR
jgi:hypothetical protein